MSDILSRAHVLKQGETFAVLDLYGNISSAEFRETGLYHEGTRFLSRLVLQLGETQPLFLSSAVREDNTCLAVDLTNPDILADGSVLFPRGTLHLRRTNFLWQGSYYEQLSVQNYGMNPIVATLSFYFDADYADVFEVRGTRRERKGRFLEAVTESDYIQLSYEGLDSVIRRTRLEFAPAPATLTSSAAHFQVSLPSRGEATFNLIISCETTTHDARRFSFSHAATMVKKELQTAEEYNTLISTSNDQFNGWLRRSHADLAMLVSETAQGPYPYAGVPWFSTPFGRDGLITALSCLWLNPGLAKGVLAYLAATQAEESDPAREAEPGKILHETRKGEMAALGEIPFGRYYGSVDATPLFVMLAGAYYERTGDRDFIQSIWTNIEAALRWMKTYGDRDGDGFIEYYRHSSRGLVNQGWKDSHDAVFHADGALARGPIAICEVQGFAYAAMRGAARLASVLGLTERGSELIHQAQMLREQFEQTFWCEELSTYALALDGDKRPCRVRSSNAGYCLLTKLASPERAQHVARTLLDDASFSGWGIRTIAASEARYNPMSYHNGSVWPHDNALIASGLSCYYFKEAVLKVLTALFDASRFVALQRLPELFCGFPRGYGEGPTLYPVACAPQAWSAASALLLLQACLGIHIDVPEARITCSHPILPESVREVQLNNLALGEGTISLLLERQNQDVSINVLNSSDSIKVVVEQ